MTTTEDRRHGHGGPGEDVLRNPESGQDVTPAQAARHGKPERVGPGHGEPAIVEYFRRRQAKLAPSVVATTRTASGQTLDWVPAESQVAGGRIASPPPLKEPFAPIAAHATRREHVAVFELEQDGAEVGPAGTVPILRKDLSKLRDTPLRRHLSKHRGSGRQLAVRGGMMIALPEEDGSHRYASTGQSTICFGGGGYLSAFDPYTETSDDFSLLQIGLSNDDTGTLQTVEAGWQEMQDIYGDWAPHLFTFYTTNGYSEEGDDKGGYNQDVDGWVQYDSQVYPGATSSPNSTPGGDQYVLQIKYQWYNDNWWLMCNGRWLGYYPSKLFMGDQSVFSTLGDHANWIGFWGEVFDSDDVSGATTTDMGSGYFAEAGWTYSAYLRNLQRQTDRSGAMADYDGGSGWASDPSMYDIQTHMNSGGTWGSYAWLGGPGSG